MRLAVLTDIHGNKQALSAVLADARARGASDFAFLGDIVGYGPDPVWCVEVARELVEAGATCLMGNHDAAAAGRPEAMNKVAQAAIYWTRSQLTSAQIAWLGALPLQARLDEVLLTHASANDPQDWNYITSDTRAAPSFRASDARVILCGHTHVPLLVSRDRAGMVQPHGFRIGQAVPLLRSRRWLAVLGSVGQPRDGSAQAGYALWDSEAASLTFLRVAYDVGATMAAIRAAGLPESLAERLPEGR